MILRPFTAWLHSFLPAAYSTSSHISNKERLRSCLGALLGIGVTAAATRLLLGPEAGLPIPMLIAPMGASAVLLFAVPASPLAQPWALVGGNLVSALSGITCARWIGDPLAAAALAVAMSIALMFWLRCIHPPSGAVALTAVLGGPAIHALGYGFVWLPVGLNTLILLAVAIVYHAATRHAYPHRAPLPVAPDRHATLLRAELDAVLASRNEVLDVDIGDLQEVLAEVESRMLRRQPEPLRKAA
ncbi:HPP family protein [Janthinobacterium agaricidamnosum NBRC 102515 = DSM 9628]|uniref:HPP family protein n=1 Tax=Janthinobacterium agaricidamnosum NBRC 102515 = DSM 9628 TaxID=1349767 RepID=W0V9R0_9BURK|nr:HPP family protein [Janthinobacterium agaricidamnosum NBRC 102515 = DSM 9628]